jgi:hypothetical protein
VGDGRRLLLHDQDTCFDEEDERWTHSRHGYDVNAVPDAWR